MIESPTAPAPDFVAAPAPEVVLIDFLRIRDVPCPLCGYNLRGLQQPRCPECGRELTLSVGLTEPLLKAWITFAAALLLPAGIGVLFTWILITEGFPRKPLMVFSILLFIASIPAAAAGIYFRRRFLKLSPTVQWRWAIGAIVSGIAAFVTFFATI
jgi:hypothetical protein